MNDLVTILKKANNSLVEEIHRLRKVEQAAKKFLVSMKKHHGVKMSEIDKLSKAVDHEHQ